MLKLSEIWPVGNSSSWFLCPFDLSPLVIEGLPVQQDVPGPSTTLPAPNLKPAISPGSPGSQQWGMIVRNQDPSALFLGPQA